MKIKIAQMGLGPIGLATARLAATRSWAEVVAGIDLDPAKAGGDLGVLAGDPALAGRPVFRTLEECWKRRRVDLVLHTAVSRFVDALPALEQCAVRGVSVVSSCEELLFPAWREPRRAAVLDRLCRCHGARIVGTGVNPGFVMEVLPLCLTGVCRAVRAIHVQRVVDASTRRGPLQLKIGSGLAPAEFERRFRAGESGHAGLQESLALLAHGLGWELTRVQETGRAVVADRDLQTAHVRVRRGQTCGLHQRAEGRCKGKLRLTLDLKMYLGAPDPHDACQIEGDPPLDLRLEGGVAGDPATVAALVNAAPRPMAAAPGLRLMSELAVPCLA